MKSQDRFFPLPALLLGAIFFFTATGGAQAATAPQITSFESATVDELTPGTELSFRVEGTPGAQAVVRIAGIQQPIRLAERSPGLYEGRYTLKRTDKPSANAAVRATLRRQNVAVTSRLATPLATATAAASAVTIQGFTMGPEPIEPGAELTFNLQGAPGGKAAVTIDRVGRTVPLTEVQPGVYQGTYTVRRQDNFTAANIGASLQANGQTARMRLPATASASAHVQSVSPRDGERVASQPVTISGYLAGNVDPRSVRILVGNVDVTRNATVTTSGFSYRPESLTPGNYRVEVLSSDYAGASSRTAWNFSVLPTAAAEATSIEFTSPSHNAQIGTGPVEVRGRGVPNSTYNAHVIVTTSLLGFVGFNQNVLARQIQTDSRGNFAFTFDPKDDLPAGTRYEVLVDGMIGGQHRENKITLVQR